MVWRDGVVLGLLLVSASQLSLAMDHDWKALLRMSFLFYEAQQSGKLPDWNRVKLGKQVLLMNGTMQPGWRNDSHVKDGRTLGVDLAGGFYDAGDHMKFTLPMTSAMNTLGIGAMLYKEGYKAAGEWDNMANTFHWGTEYLKKCRLGDGFDDIVISVGDIDRDHAWWGRPEQYPRNITRTVNTTKTFKSADVQGGMAATFALSAMIHDSTPSLHNMTYSNELLDLAKGLLKAADASQAVPAQGQIDEAYRPRHWQDEVALGYLMVCWYELQRSLLDAGMPELCMLALQRYDAARGPAASSSWDWDNAYLAASIMLQYLSPLLQRFNNGEGFQQAVAAAQAVQDALAAWQDTSMVCPQIAPDQQVCYTTGGLVHYSPWGNLRYAMNAAFAATIQATTLMMETVPQQESARQHRCWAYSQLSFAVGDNGARQSYVVGYNPNGITSPSQPHHRSSSCSPNYNVTCNKTQEDTPLANPSVLIGALVGGPDGMDFFSNNRSDHNATEVALDYNAGFTSLLAAVYQTKLRLESSANPCTWEQYCEGSCTRWADVPLNSTERTASTTRLPAEENVAWTPVPGDAEQSSSGLQTSDLIGIIVGAALVALLVVYLIVGTVVYNKKHTAALAEMQQMLVKPQMVEMRGRPVPPAKWK